MADLKKNLSEDIIVNDTKDEPPPMINSSKALYLEKIVITANKSIINSNPMKDIQTFEEGSSDNEDEGKQKEEQEHSDLIKKLDFNQEVLNTKLEKFPLSKDNFSHLLVEYSTEVKRHQEIICIETFEGKLKQPYMCKYITENLQSKLRKETTWKCIEKMEKKYRSYVLGKYFHQLRQCVKCSIAVSSSLKRCLTLLTRHCLQQYFSRWKNARIKLINDDAVSCPVSLFDNNQGLESENTLKHINQQFREAMRRIKTIEETSVANPSKLVIGAQTKPIEAITVKYNLYLTHLKLIKDDRLSSQCRLKTQLGDNPLDACIRKYLIYQNGLKCIKEDKTDSAFQLPFESIFQSFKDLSSRCIKYQKGLKQIFEDSPCQYPNFAPSLKSNELLKVNLLYEKFKRKSSSRICIDDPDSTKLRYIHFEHDTIKKNHAKFTIFHQQYKIANPEPNPLMLVNQPDGIDLMNGLQLIPNEMESVIQQYYRTNTKRIFRKMVNDTTTTRVKLSNTPLIIILKLKEQLIKDKPVYRQYISDKQNDRLKDLPIKTTRLLHDINVVFKSRYHRAVGNDDNTPKPKQLPCPFLVKGISDVIGYYKSHYVKTIEADDISIWSLPFNRFGHPKMRLDNLIGEYNKKYLKKISQDSPNDKMPKRFSSHIILKPMILKYEKDFNRVITSDKISPNIHLNRNKTGFLLKQLTSVFLKDNPIPIIKTFTADEASIHCGLSSPIKDSLSKLEMINAKYYHYNPKENLKTFTQDSNDNRLDQFSQSVPLSIIYQKCDHYYRSKYHRSIKEDKPDCSINISKQSIKMEEPKLILLGIHHQYKQYYQNKFKHSISDDKLSKALKLYHSDYPLTSTHSILDIEMKRLSSIRLRTFNSDGPNSSITLAQSNKSINHIWTNISKMKTEAELQLIALIRSFLSFSNLVNSIPIEKDNTLIDQIKATVATNDDLSNNARYIDFIQSNRTKAFNSGYMLKIRQDIEEQISNEEEENNILLTQLRTISNASKIEIIITNDNKSNHVWINKQSLETIIQLSNQSNINLIQYTEIRQPPIEESKVEAQQVSNIILEKASIIIENIISQHRQKKTHQSFIRIKDTSTDNSINSLSNNLTSLVDSLKTKGVNINGTQMNIATNQLEQIKSLRRQQFKLKRTKDLARIVELTFSFFLNIRGSIRIKSNKQLSYLIEYYEKLTQSLSQRKKLINKSELNGKSKAMSLVKMKMRSTAYKSNITASNGKNGNTRMVIKQKQIRIKHIESDISQIESQIRKRNLIDYHYDSSNYSYVIYLRIISIFIVVYLVYQIALKSN